MTTIAIVGAGRGLGVATARRFGREGFDVALLSRRQENVDALAGDLAAAGISARGYSADVRDTGALTRALGAAEMELGAIEVLAYSPLPQKEFLRPVLETTAEDLTAAVEFSILGPVAAVNRVLPGLRDLGRGSILFVNGGSAALPNSKVAGTSIAFAGETAYASMLHDTLSDAGIQVGQLIVPGAITPGHPTHDPDVLADLLWHLHTHAGQFRAYAEDVPGAWEPTGSSAP